MKALIIFLVRNLYQRLLRPALHAISGGQGSCRFTPSCSNYFIEAVQTHGAIKGSLMGTWRVLRCNPWGGHGHDPVPPRKP